MTVIVEKFNELKDNQNCIFAQITEQYIYGGMLQGDKLLDEFTRN